MIQFTKYSKPYTKGFCNDTSCYFSYFQLSLSFEILHSFPSYLSLVGTDHSVTRQFVCFIEPIPHLEVSVGSQWPQGKNSNINPYLDLFYEIKYGNYVVFEI